eukprot:CAMPEP_0184752574 /NCGR_PEP_ID=MMETSP0315-20130426/43648_1 /TAXON_ID=101924 /ORGANISM="Rhodosorus marinus, Strain UTEX LB 2760" /LENGTH=547 /DNA_ID=CAMNT_0027231913 /DNA_START=1256 /DNA_END=2899 /DNA_ORIENTATION=+
MAVSRTGDDGYWSVAAGKEVKLGDLYRFRMETEGGTECFYRRDPYARHTTGGDSKWCVITDRGESFAWTDWEPRPFDENIIYEMHIGSFTEEGTLEAAIEKLDHVAGLGFTALELMPMAEFSHATESWGYNPRQLLAIHPEYGSPDMMRKFVNRAHELKMGVIIDVVLHHGSVDGNELWDYDGWSHEGGIYHERAGDTPWGKQFAFWKTEVMDMLRAACSMWLGSEYRCDGLRFDSVNDLPPHVVTNLTWAMHEQHPGRILTAEVTPENPQALHDYGLDSLWVHSGYFDIIQQHRALGRGHHGGGDWAEGWNLPRLRTVMALHYGFESPTQCVKYILGSHDQVGCSHGGGHYEDYKMIGGQHRYAADQFGGGRGDAGAVNAVRLWYGANIGASGLVMMFMGSEWHQHGWWNPDEHHGLDWSLGEDDVGKKMCSLVQDANALREKYVCLRRGGVRILHEDRANGIMASERTFDTERIVIVVNAGQNGFGGGEYGVWVEYGRFEQIFSTQDPKYSGWDDCPNNTEDIVEYDGKIHLRIPHQCTLFLLQK